MSNNSLYWDITVFIVTAGITACLIGAGIALDISILLGVLSGLSLRAGRLAIAIYQLKLLRSLYAHGFIKLDVTNKQFYTDKLGKKEPLPMLNRWVSKITDDD